MLKDAFGEAFSRLWSKLGITWVTALAAMVNPVFLWMVLQILWVLTGRGPQTVEEIGFFVVAWSTVSLIVHVFPTSYAGLEYMRGVYEMDVVYFRRFFGDYWRALKKTWLRSLQLTVFFGVLGVVLGYALVFYGTVIAVEWVRMVFLAVLVWVYVAVALAQFVLLPMILYNPKIKLFEALRYSVRFLFAEIVMVAGMALLDVVAFVLLSMGYGFALLVYYLFGFHFRLAVYKQIQAKYLQASASDESVPESEQISRAWLDLMESRKEKRQSKK